MTGALSLGSVRNLICALVIYIDIDHDLANPYLAFKGAKSQLFQL